LDGQHYWSVSTILSENQKERLVDVFFDPFEGQLQACLFRKKHGTRSKTHKPQMEVAGRLEHKI